MQKMWQNTRSIWGNLYVVRESIYAIYVHLNFGRIEGFMFFITNYVDRRVCVVST